MTHSAFFSTPADERRAPEWLDEIRGERALAWVRDRDEESERALGGPMRDALEEEIHEVLTSPDRIPGVVLRGEWAYNFWTDEEHPRGLWRRQPAEDYLAGGEDWDILIDVDALAAEEGRSLVWHGAAVLRPGFDRALIELSEAGSDADETREFDLIERRWITPEEGGFARATARGALHWVSRELVWRLSADDGRVSDSGYPLEARLVPRGADPASLAPLLRAPASDLGLFVGVDRTPGFEHSLASFAHDFLHSTSYLIAHPITPDTVEEEGRTLPLGAVRIDAPDDAGIATWREWLLITPRGDWEVGGVTRPGGSLLAFRLEDYLAGDRTHEALFLPEPHSSLRALTVTRSRIVLTLLVDVVTRLLVLAPPQAPGGSWRSAPLALDALEIVEAGDEGGARATPAQDRSAAPRSRLRIPELSTVAARAAAPLDDDRLWLTVSGFTTPTTLLLAELPASESLEPDSALLVRRAGEFFDATGIETSQHWGLFGHPVGVMG